MAAGQVGDIEIWILAAAIGLGMLSTRFLPVAVIAALLLFTVRVYSTGRLSKRTPLDIPVILLFTTLPVTLYATAFPQITVPQVLRMLAGLAFFYSLINWASSRKRIGQFTASLVLAGAGLAALAPFSVTWYTGNKLPFIPTALYNRFAVLVSDAVHPNVMGGNLAILLPICIGLLFFYWRGLGRIKLVVLCSSSIMMVGVLFLTKSRGAWMGLVAALLVLGLLAFSKWWKLITTSAILSITAFFILAPSSLIDTLMSSDVIGGVDGRLEIFSRSILMIRDFPLTGIGMGAYSNVVDTFYPFFLFSPGQIVHAHNLFLQVAIDLGIPGLIGWLAIFLIVSLLAIRLYQRACKDDERFFMSLGAGLLGCQFVLAVHGLTDAVTWGMVKPAPLVWALWGLVIAAYNFQLAQPSVSLPVEKNYYS